MSSNLTNMVVYAAVGTQAISFPVTSIENKNLIKELKSSKVELTNNSLSESLFNVDSTSYFFDQEKQRINTILNFSKSLIEKSQDIESEYVDIVNENFWDLI